MIKAVTFALVLCALTSLAMAQDTPPKDTPSTTKQATAAATTKTFTDYQMGMSFDYPSSWTLVTDPNAKKEKKGFDINRVFKKKKKDQPTGPKQSSDETLFYLPTNGHAADLEIYSALFDKAPEDWENIQQYAAKDLGRTIVKQWREEILGVPLLLTQLSYNDAGGPVYTLSGLVYSRTPYKMQFVLTANTDDFEAADYEFRQALQSLRTTSGTLPLPEDPNHPLDPTAYKNVVNKPPKELVMNAPQPATAAAKKGTIVVKTVVATKDALLTMPEGWSADAPAADGTITLHNAAVKGSITISLASTLDSDPPQSAILKATAQSLVDFDKVDKRSETSKDFSTAGAATNTIWRQGSGANGAMTSCEAYGATNDMYWLLRYHLVGTATPAEMKVVDALIDGMSVDPAT